LVYNIYNNVIIYNNNNNNNNNFIQEGAQLICIKLLCSKQICKNIYLTN